MPMKIKLIAQGSNKWERFIRRWGVSFLIGEDVIFDTFGDPYVFLRNIERMNIDLSKIKHIVISHDHWDHISGLWYIIRRFKNINISEQALVVNSENGLIVITGCAHPGILTILKEVKKNFPDKEILCALGGFHLLGKERKDIELIVSELKKIGIKKVGPTHCSGKEAEGIFKNQYRENFIPIKAEEIIEI